MIALLILALTPAAVALACWQAWKLIQARRQFKTDMDRLDQWATETEQRMRGAA